MSATATEHEVTSDETVVDDLDMGGSPEAIQADTETDETEDGAEAPDEKDEGEEPESGGPPEVDSETRERIADLEAEIKRRDEVLGALNDRMDRDPAFRKMLEGGGGDDPADDPIAHFEETITNGLEPAAAEVMRNALKPLLQRQAELESQVRDMTPRVKTLTKSLGSRKFQSGLASEGVTPAMQASPEFQKHLRRMRSTGMFQSMESKAPEVAAEFAASKFLLSRAKTSGWKDERARLRSAKGGKGGDASSARSSANANKVHTIPREGDYIARAHAIRLKDPDAEIRYTTPK